MKSIILFPHSRDLTCAVYTEHDQRVCLFICRSTSLEKNTNVNSLTLSVSNTFFSLRLHVPIYTLQLQDAIPALKMENNQSASDTQDNSMMESIDQRAHSTKGCGDLVTRRLKNRERQRRYRARKRLESGTTDSFGVEQTPAMQVDLQSNRNRNNFVTRIYCNRDWKKDARRAHLTKCREMSGSIDHSMTSANVPEETRLGAGNKSETMLDREIQSGSSNIVYNQTPRTVLCRRDWKAEARRKKN